MKKYVVGYKSKEWRHLGIDWLIQDFSSKKEAMETRQELKGMGFIQTCVKLVKGERSLSDF